MVRPCRLRLQSRPPPLRQRQLMSRTDSLAAIEARIGHTFRDRSLLQLALTHPSWSQDHRGERENNQRLEFLGDAILHGFAAEAIYHRYPQGREGVLTRHRAALANGTFLAQLAREIGLDAALRLGGAEEASGGRTRDKALEDAFEALIGAVYLDAGHDTARRVVLGIYGDLAARLKDVDHIANPKGRLQEIIQPLHGTAAIRYEVKAETGKDHEREFEIAVYLHDRLLGSGRGHSKKSAEEAAAREALARIALR
ncbi:MAG: ribonuclease III [Opitutaceae bacterium]|nr:ribonuclease III [Opitutaceae bacterium]